jgi:hypothetical protein
MHFPCGATVHLDNDSCQSKAGRIIGDATNCCPKLAFVETKAAMATHQGGSLKNGSGRFRRI